MFEEFSKRNRAISAAMALAAMHDWGDVTLAAIAAHANLDLSDLRRDFVCKDAILRAFQAEVDVEVLAKAMPAGDGDSVRDRVFETLMTRFEILTPYRPALKRIARYLRRHPGEASMFACSRLMSQYWMLARAGAKLNGAGAAVRVAGLAGIYGKTFNVWLEDDTPSLDKTMATLDRGVGNGERAIRTMENVCGTVCGFVRGLKRNAKSKDEPKAKPAADEGAPAPAPV